MALAAHHEPTVFPWAGLVLGGIGITGLVVARQTLVQKEISEAAATDVLTGLANRARLHREMNRALHRAARAGHRIAVLIIDLNGFKQINDTLGHQAGDALLVAVADAMRGAVRPGDLVARLGGDEFAVLADDIPDEATVVALQRGVADAIVGPFVIGERPMNASAGIGAAVSEPGELSADELLHRADVAMYDAKQSRRTTAEPPEHRLSYRLIASPDGEIIGMEAAPAGEFALGRAIAEAGARRDGRYVVVSVTADQLRRRRFADDVTDALTAAGLSGPALVLAVPETTAPAVAHLRALGVRIAVSALGPAVAGEADVLKVDVPDPAAAAAVVGFARALGLATLIGGVEVPAGARDHAGPAG
jgi:diguanylate cyclase